jgi:hypothetical protein
VSTRAKILVGVAALGVLAFFLVRGAEPTAHVRSLEADPMATYVPPGGTLVDTDSRNEGSALGEPVLARYTRLFQLTRRGSEGAVKDARARAKASGWTQVRRADARVFLADKRAPSGRLELNITLFEDSLLLPHDVKPPALLVSLRRTGP